MISTNFYGQFDFNKPPSARVVPFTDSELPLSVSFKAVTVIVYVVSGSKSTTV